MVRRVRGAHATFDASRWWIRRRQLLGGNYFRVTSAICVRNASSGLQLSLFTDRGQGALADQLPATSDRPQFSLRVARCR